ncbi:MAG: hypothetical protein ABSG33_09570 [Candidatus Bathyarchaeia archaeon]
MPSIIPGYVYTLFAALVVGAIIVSACTLVTMNVKNEATEQQLTNIDQAVATQSLQLITRTAEDSQNFTQFLDLPPSVGNQMYWVCIGNDSSGTWVSSGFGSTVSSNQPKIYIPAEVTASGVFVSSYGSPCLECCSANQTVSLTLSGDYQI